MLSGLAPTSLAHGASAVPPTPPSLNRQYYLKAVQTKNGCYMQTINVCLWAWNWTVPELAKQQVFRSEMCWIVLYTDVVVAERMSWLYINSWEHFISCMEFCTVLRWYQCWGFSQHIVDSYTVCCKAFEHVLCSELSWCVIVFW